MSRGINDIAPLAALHVVVDRDRSSIFIAFAVDERCDADHHMTCRLVSYHFSKDSRTYRASDPVLFSFEIIEAALVKQMTAGKTNDVFIALLHELIFIILHIVILELAYTALVM